jgi:hypothetical protein
MTPVPSAVPTPRLAPMPSASVEPVTPTVTR